MLNKYPLLQAAIENLKENEHLLVKRHLFQYVDEQNTILQIENCKLILDSLDQNKSYLDYGMGVGILEYVNELEYGHNITGSDCMGHISADFYSHFRSLLGQECKHIYNKITDNNFEVDIPEQYDAVIVLRPTNRVFENIDKIKFPASELILKFDNGEHNVYETRNI